MGSNSNMNPFLMEGGCSQFKDMACVLIVGLNHHDANETTCLSIHQDSITLAPDPDNVHDSKAITAMLNGSIVGHVSKAHTTRVHEMLNKDRIFNYVPAAYVDRIPVENRDPLLIRVNEAIVVMYNGEAYPDAPPLTNVWELTEPKFKGQIGIKNPMSSGSTLMGVATLVQYPDEMADAYKRHTGSDIELGEGVPDAGYEFVRRLLANDIVIFKSGSKLAGASGLRGQDKPLLSIANMTYIARND